MVYTVSGISVLDITRGHKTVVLDCAWKNINNISFDVSYCHLIYYTHAANSLCCSIARSPWLLWGSSQWLYMLPALEGTKCSMHIGKEKHTLSHMYHDRAAYLLRFAKLCHKFHISTRDPQPPHLRPLSLSHQIIAVTTTPAKPAQPVKPVKSVEGAYIHHT